MVDIYEPTSYSAWSEKVLEVFYSSARESLIAEFKEAGINLINEDNKLRNLEILYEEFVEGAKTYESKQEKIKQEAMETAFDEFVDAVAERIRQKEQQEGNN